MIIRKCDICKKELKEQKDMVLAGCGWPFPEHLFCAACGKPVVSFLKKHKLLETATFSHESSYRKK